MCINIHEEKLQNKAWLNKIEVKKTQVKNYKLF